MSANIGQEKFKLYFIRGNWDIAAGTIINVDYSLLSKSLFIVHNKPHAIHSDLLQSMSGLASCIFTKLATIHVVQKSIPANPLHRNLQVAKMGNMWGDASLLDSSAYLPQLDMTKVERI